MRNARPQKEWRKGVRTFLFSRSARPQKGLVRRPQSKAPHALAWLCIEMKQGIRMDARSGRSISPHPLESEQASLEGAWISFDAPQ
jgi:hypothetical protein